MKKIFNNKGMTLVEIILSIGLVSIVMVQVLNILVDLKDEQLLGKDKTVDLTNRSVIIKNVQNDLRTHVVTEVKNCGSTDSTDIGPYTKKSCFQMKLKTGASSTIYKMYTASKGGYDYFIYGHDTSSGFRYEAWKLISGTYKTKAGHACNYIFNAYEKQNKRYFSIFYPVVLNKVNEKSSMNFDLEFLYYHDSPTLASGSVSIEDILTDSSNTIKLKSCRHW